LIYNDDIDKILKGFCAIFKRKNYYYLDNFMILKNFRGQKYANILMMSCLEYFKKETIKSLTNNAIQMHLFEKFGFTKTGNKGSYIAYERIGSNS
jgi:GNAT superfamily N-acetyltransferase